jgi:hypothetical protein
MELTGLFRESQSMEQEVQLRIADVSSGDNFIQQPADYSILASLL